MATCRSLLDRRCLCWSGRSAGSRTEEAGPSPLLCLVAVVVLTAPALPRSPREDPGATSGASPTPRSVSPRAPPHAPLQHGQSQLPGGTARKPRQYVWWPRSHASQRSSTASSPALPHSCTDRRGHKERARGWPGARGFAGESRLATQRARLMAARRCSHSWRRALTRHVTSSYKWYVVSSSCLGRSISGMVTCERAPGIVVRKTYGH